MRRARCILTRCKPQREDSHAIELKEGLGPQVTWKLRVKYLVGASAKAQAPGHSKSSQAVALGPAHESSSQCVKTVEQVHA